MMNNKKIKNTSAASFNGINFKSTTEMRIYKALLEEGINPDYEKITFNLVDGFSPTIPFYNRIRKRFQLDYQNILPVTYTPDFTFELNGVLVIMEVKGFENDIFPLKRKLFRKYLETLGRLVMFFEVRTKREALEALRLATMETEEIQKIRNYIKELPSKDVTIGNKLLDERNWEELNNLVYSATVRIEKAELKGSDKYANINLNALYELLTIITKYI